MLLTWPAPLIRRLGRDRSGLALMEFAFSLPILLSLLLLGLECVNLAMAHLRVSQIAMLTADSASRVRLSIDEADVNEIMLGSAMMGEAMDFADHGRIILSSLEENEDANGQWIRWQRCLGRKQEAPSWGSQGNGEDDASLQFVGPDDQRIWASPGTAVMVVEVFYDYRPLITDLLGAHTMHYVQAFAVRDRVDQDLRVANDVEQLGCDRFTGI